MTESGVRAGLTYAEMRDVLRAHFKQMLDAQRAAIERDGHLGPLVIHSLREAARRGHTPSTTSFKAEADTFAIDAYMVREIYKGTGTNGDLSDDELQTFVNEYRRADAAYAQAVLDIDADSDAYNFGASSTSAANAPTNNIDNQSGDTGVTLEELVQAHTEYMKLEKQWTGKTELEKEGHFSLLYEVLAKDHPVTATGRVEAHKVRNVLRKLPPNRHKSAALREKSLTEILDMQGLPTLHVRSINKYLNTYSGLFGWAVQNGYCKENPFGGLVLNTTKAIAEDDERTAFLDVQMSQILSALLSDQSVKPHHRWGTLIAAHTGARLNEVAQLHLDDVYEKDGVWCFDINQTGETKRLKNRQSKRIVPVHPKLTEYGFLTYLESVSSMKGNTRLFPQLTYSASDGYGRNLGRWVNEQLLPNLGIKTRQLTFHSLRHTVIGKLNAAEVQQSHVMALVGHEPGTTTMKVYNRNGFPPAFYSRNCLRFSTDLALTERSQLRRVYVFTQVINPDLV